MRIAFVVIGNSRRSNYLNGFNLRYGNGGGSGTDTSTVLVAEYLAKQGHEVVYAADKIDEALNLQYKEKGIEYRPGEEFYGVKYTNKDFEGIPNKEFDILISMLWFEAYDELPITVTKALIYWSHMQWVYGTFIFVEYAKKYNLALGLVHISKWEEEKNASTFLYIQSQHSSSKKALIPNPVFDEIVKETKAKNITKQKGKFIFHASWPRGGNVAAQAVRELDIPNKELHAFDYLMVIHDHSDEFFRNHNGVDKRTLFKHLAESEYFIYPLYTPYQDVHKDTFSCVVAEALALGVIVVTYPLGALPENFNDYCVWLDPPEGADFAQMQTEPLSKDLEGKFTCTDNIVAKINYLEANPQLKEEYRTKAQDYILETFNIEKVGKMWVDFIDSLLESKNTNDLLLQKYDIEPRDYEVKDYDKNQSAFFYVFRHDHIGYEIKAGKVWEPHLHQIFEKYITKNSVVLEGGCHVGTHSVKLSMLSKKLYCFEPLKESNSLLRKNLQRNDCSNTEVFNVALSDREGESYFAWMPLFNLGGSGLDNNPMGIPGSGDVQTTEQERYPVKTVTIDSLNLNELDFIKLDVEGYEPKVIEGALETIKKFRPVITLESWSNHFGQTDIEHTKKQFKILLDLNYSVEQVGISDWLFLPL